MKYSKFLLVNLVLSLVRDSTLFQGIFLFVLPAIWFSIFKTFSACEAVRFADRREFQLIFALPPFFYYFPMTFKYWWIQRTISDLLFVGEVRSDARFNLWRKINLNAKYNNICEATLTRNVKTLNAKKFFIARHIYKGRLKTEIYVLLHRLKKNYRKSTSCDAELKT